MKKTKTAKKQRRRDDTDRLNWVGLYVTEINSVVTKPGEKVELIWWSDTEKDNKLTVRRGKTMAEAFRNALEAAMNEDAELKHG
jgi:hypothetical protein